MLTPHDKITRPGGNDIMQIVVTRKCDLFHCSNCTQLLPFRRDDVEMELDVFRQAVRSMSGWTGVIALFGGNPCTHGRFPDLCAILAEEVPDQRRRGLWSNSLLSHGEIAHETFFPHGRCNFNVHGSAEASAEFCRWFPNKPVYGLTGRDHHAPMLMDRRDFGIDDEHWIELRESCDINQKWSGAIYQRTDPDGRARAYGYFCEVAGSLDGVRGENHGLLAVPGWWRLPIDRFSDQVSQCCDRGCGVPLRRCGHEDRQNTYDVSRSMVSLTIHGKLKGAIVEHGKLPPPTHEFTDYIGLRKPREKAPA